jgi:hypothetical protein
MAGEPTLDERYGYTLETLSADGVSDGAPEAIHLAAFLEDNDFEPEEIAELMARS